MVFQEQQIYIHINRHNQAKYKLVPQMKIFPFLLSAALLFLSIDAKKKKKKNYKSVTLTMTRTAKYKTIKHTVIQQMTAPTNYKKKGDCYCKI